jgi:hypothetical protein
MRWRSDARRPDSATSLCESGDNFCDFSHISYVHENTFAQGEQDWASTLPKITLLDNGIRFQRCLPGILEAFGATKDRIDLWNSYDYVVPGVLSMLTLVCPAGTSTRYGGNEPPEWEFSTAISANFTFQVVTPLSARKSRYFFAYGTRHSENPALLGAMYQVTVAAFNEDKRVITAQQENIDLSSGKRFGAIAHDRGPGHLRVLIQKRLKEEAAANESTAA